MLLLLLACHATPTRPPDPSFTVATDPTSPLDSASDDSGTTGADSATADSGVTDSDTSDGDSADSSVDTAPQDDPRYTACLAMTTAATAFLSTLDADQQDRLTFPLDDPERQDWSNLPAPVKPRDGLYLGDLDEIQKAAAYALLESGLSLEGFGQAQDVIAVDEQYGANDEMLGEKFYSVVVFGTPAGDTPWAWQLDGHHLVYNFTVACNNARGDEDTLPRDAVAMVPAFLGIDPTEVDEGALLGLRAMAEEQDRSLALLQSLDEAQQEVAIAADVAPGGIIAGPGADGRFPDVAGICGVALDVLQRDLLLDLISVWVLDQEDAAAAAKMLEVEADLDDTCFTWEGDTFEGGTWYYRVHGPRLYIELNHMTATHIHAVYRDPRDDYGVDLLAEHLLLYPH